MKTRRLGNDGPEVSAIGLGCMPLTTPAYGPIDLEESLATVNSAIDSGMNFFDSAQHYGDGKNEELIAKAIKGRREKVVIASKFGTIVHADGHRSVTGRPELIPDACEGSLKRLGTDYLDVYYLHRIDPDVPVEETVGGMAKLVEQGKVRFLGLCEAAPATLERACKIHQITVLQSEYSLWSRFAEDELFDACLNLGIGYVAYCPLGHGFLTAAVKSSDILGEKDQRHSLPRFDGENLARNVALLGPLEDIARAKNATPSQIALGWILAQGDHLVPIPGTRRRTHLKENIEAADIALSKDEIDQLTQTFTPDAVSGERWPESGMKRMNG